MRLRTVMSGLAACLLGGTARADLLTTNSDAAPMPVIATDTATVPWSVSNPPGFDRVQYAPQSPLFAPATQRDEAPAGSVICSLGGCLPRGAAPVNLLTNASFELPVAGVQVGTFPDGTGYSYFTSGSGGGTQTVGGWQWTNAAGVINARTATAWFGATPPSGFVGAQYAFLQSSAAAIAQSFTLTQPTLLIISWLATGRPADGLDGNPTYGDTSYTVTIGDLSQTDSTTSGAPFASQSLTGMFDPGTYTLAFVNTSPPGDHTTFIDDVAVTPGLSVSADSVPEPASGALLLVGLLGLSRCRRR